MLNKLFFLFALAFVLGSAGASATQTDTLWSKGVSPNTIADAKFTPSGDSIITIIGSPGYDTLCIIETSTGNYLKKIPIPFTSMRFCLFHNSTKMAVRGLNSDVFVWDYANDTLVCHLLNKFLVFCLDITPDDSKLLMGTAYNKEGGGYKNYQIMIYNLSLQNYTDSIASVGGIGALSVSPDGLYFATDNYIQDPPGGPFFNKLILWNLTTLQIIKDFGPNRTYGDITDIKFSPDSKYIGIAKWDGTVNVYRTDYLDLYRNFVVSNSSDGYGPVRVCFSHNSQYLYAGLFIPYNYTTKVFSIDNNELSYTYEASSDKALDVSGSENIIVADPDNINLLSPHWLSVTEPQQDKNEQPTGYIISKSGNQALNIQSNCRNLGSCRLYDVFGNLLPNENILSLIDNGNISINPVQLNIGVYFLAVGLERTVKVIVVE